MTKRTKKIEDTPAARAEALAWSKVHIPSRAASYDPEDGTVTSYRLGRRPGGPKWVAYRESIVSFVAKRRTNLESQVAWVSYIKGYSWKRTKEHVKRQVAKRAEIQATYERDIALFNKPGGGGLSPEQLEYCRELVRDNRVKALESLRQCIGTPIANCHKQLAEAQQQLDRIAPSSDLSVSNIAPNYERNLHE